MKGGTPYVRLEGDKERAESLLRRARTELQRTKDVAARMGVSDYQRMVRVDEDSYIITKIFTGGIEIINIYAAPYVPREVVTEEEKEEFLEPKKVYSIYSGFVYPGWMLKVIDPETSEETWPNLNQFNPTEWCRKTNPNDFDPDLNYQDVPRIAIEKNLDFTSPQAFGWFGRQLGYPPSGAKASQYNSVRPCSYTGLMAKVVSIICGYGTFNVTSEDEYDDLLIDVRNTDYSTHVKNNGFQVMYDNRYTRCHSITKGSDGTLWLVETSVVNGIIAMPLKYLDPSKFNRNPSEDWPVSVAFEELGGLPSGETFPQSRNEVLQEIALGQIIQIMSPEDYGAQLTDDWNEYSEDNCWAWNEDGTEGRVTAFRYYEGDINVKELGYFQITIDIGELKDPPYGAHRPVGSGTAAITSLKNPELFIAGYKLSNDPNQFGVVPPVKVVGNSRGRGSFLSVPCSYYQRESDTYSNLNISTTKEKWEEYEAKLNDIMEAVVWVGYINGAWDELVFKQHKFTDLEDYYYSYAQPSNSFITAGGLEWTTAIPMAKNPFRGKVNWNAKGLPIIHWGHIYSPTYSTGYSENNYTKDYVGLRWWSNDGLSQIHSTNFLSGWSNSGNDYFIWTNLHVDEETGDETYDGVLDGTAYSSIHTFEVTYSTWWSSDFPELLSQVQIPPHNRSAYFYYEHEYYSRDNGPYHSGPGEPNEHPTIRTSCGTQSTRFRVGSGRGIKISEELPVGVSSQLSPSPLSTYPDVSASSGSLFNPLAYNPALPASFPGDMTDPDNYWYESSYVYVNWPVNGYARVTQNQTPYPFTYNHVGHKVWDVHPNDFVDGYLNKCGEWHNRVEHITTDYGERPYGYKSANYFAEGFPYCRIYPYDTSYSSGDYLAVAWYPFLGMPDAPAEHCTPFGSSPPNDPVSVPEAQFPDEVNTQVLIKDDYFSWKPYLDYNSYMICDRIGKVQFENKKLESTSFDHDSDLSDLRFHLTAQNRHCQHSVMGEPAVIYSDLNTQSNKGLGYYGIKLQGIAPELPDSGGDDEQFKLITFIGVNSE